MYASSAPFPGAIRIGAFVLLALAGIASLSGQAMANGARWIVVSIAGDAQIKLPGGHWKAASKDIVAAPGTALKTGPGGRIVLRSGKDSITVSPKSALEIPQPDGKGAFANIMQKLGTLLFKVETRPTSRFEVHTPYLAAVVKGTTFTVTVGAQGGALHVVEGAVEVSSLSSNDIALIRPGQTAQVAARPGAGMTVIDGLPKGKPADQSQRSPDKQDKSTPATQKRAEAGTNGAANAAPSATTGQARAKLARTVGLEPAEASEVRPGLKIRRTLGKKKIDIGSATNGFIRTSTPNPQPGRGNATAAGNAGNGKGIGNQTASLPAAADSKGNALSGGNGVSSVGGNNAGGVSGSAGGGVSGSVGGNVGGSVGGGVSGSVGGDVGGSVGGGVSGSVGNGAANGIGNGVPNGVGNGVDNAVGKAVGVGSNNAGGNGNGKGKNG